MGENSDRNDSLGFELPSSVNPPMFFKELLRERAGEGNAGADNAGDMLLDGSCGFCCCWSDKVC